MKALWMIVGILVALLVVGYSAWSVGASRALDAAIGEAEVTYRLESFTVDYPPREASTEAALRLDELVGRVGLSVIPKAERVGNEPSGLAEWEAVKPDVSSYMSSVRAAANDGLSPVPGNVAAFLALHASDLDEVEALLLSDEEIRFMSRLDRGPDSPLPNLLGQLNLTRLLATTAMAATIRGDEDSAWRSLEAAYRLEHTLADQPALICRLISIADLKIVAAAARQLKAPAPAWVQELEARDPREELVEGIRGEVFFLTAFFRSASAENWNKAKKEDGIDAVFNPLSRPLFLWDASYTLRDLDRLTEYATETDRCAFDSKTASAAIEPRPWWANMRIMMPNIESAFSRANQAALAIEGTRAVLDLKKDPDAFTERASSVCAGESWIATPQAHGSLQVRFTGSIIAPENQPTTADVATEHVIAKR